MTRGRFPGDRRCEHMRHRRPHHLVRAEGIEERRGGEPNAEVVALDFPTPAPVLIHCLRVTSDDVGVECGLKDSPAKRRISARTPESPSGTSPGRMSVAWFRCWLNAFTVCASIRRGTSGARSPTATPPIGQDVDKFQGETGRPASMRSR